MKQSSGDEPAGFFARRVASFGHAIRGVGFAFRSETNAKIHLVVTVAVVSAGLYFELSANEWCSISLAIGLVIASEILNTAIERLVDIVSPEHNAAAGRVKDIAAGATLICCRMFGRCRSSNLRPATAEHPETLNFKLNSIPPRRQELP